MLPTEPEESFESSIDLREYAHLFWSWAWLPMRRDLFTFSLQPQI